MRKAWLGYFVLLVDLTNVTAVFAQTNTTPSGIVLEAEGLVDIKNTRGKVVASTNIQLASRVVKKDAPIYEGETIVTGSNGKLKLQFAEGKNEVLLGPNTTLVVQRAPFDLRMKRGTRLFLDAGSIDSVIKQKYSGQGDDEFAIETRTLVAGVRGTTFKVEHDQYSGVSWVEVYSGSVEVRSTTDGTTRGLLKANQKISSRDWTSTTSKPQAAASDNSDTGVINKN